MIAEELNRALRNEDRWREANSCPRERQFHELYNVLGDKAAQDKIREQAEHRPCFILRRHPDACECLPEDVGESGKKGQPCPNNPFAREVGLLAELEEQSALLSVAKYFDDLVGIHGVDPNLSTPEEWTVIRIMMQRREHRQLEAIQEAIQAGMLRVLHVKPGGKDA